MFLAGYTLLMKALMPEASIPKSNFEAFKTHLNSVIELKDLPFKYCS